MLLLKSGDIELNPGPPLDIFSKIIHLNICSLRNKILDLEVELSSDCDILCLTETRIDNNFNDNDILIPGFILPIFRRDESCRSGGICVQLKGSLAATRLYNYESPDLELLWLQVKAPGRAFILGVGYRNPALRVEYWERIDNNISRVVDAFGSQNIILVGDFNEDLLNRNLTHLTDILDSYNLHQLITSPTRITPNTSTLLDPIIVGQTSLVHSAGTLPASCSDHCPVFVNLNIELPKRITYKRRIYDYNRSDWQTIENELDRINWNEVLGPHNTDNNAETITSIILNLINIHIPNKTIKTTNRDKPWVTKEIKREIRKRNNLYQKAKNSKTVYDWAVFKRQRNRVTLAIRKAKESHLDNLANKLCNGKKSEKGWWKIVKQVTNINYKESSIPCLLDNNNDLLTDPLLKAELLNSHFAEICTVDDTHIPLYPDRYHDGEILSSVEITPELVYEELKALDISKAAGPDGISPIVLKKLAAPLCEPLCIIYKKEIQEHKHPCIWKFANITPIFKKDDPRSPSNYRPISLLNILGKVMEKLVFKSVFRHIAPHLTSSQSGFLPNHSTVTQLLEIHHVILDALDHKKEVAMCFLDISKAFDRVSHRALINKLRQFNIGGDLLLWFSDYLSNRKQRTTIDGAESTWKDVLAGVPQGSILGPLLFLIFINDIVDNINCIIRIFADDTSLLLPSIDLDSDLTLLQRDLDRVLEWAKKWAVTFNSKKTEALLVSRRRTPTQSHLTFENFPVEMSSEHKHLGLIFNTSATWNNHLNEIISKSNKRLGILRNLKYKLNRDTLHTLYITYVRSLLEYADSVWDNMPEYISNRLEKININAIRCITGLTVSAHRVCLYRESGLLPLHKRRKFHRLVQMYKIFHRLCPDYLHDLLPPTVAQRNPYPMRNPTNLTIPATRTESFRRSFIPSTIRDWNSIPDNIKSAPSIASFKFQLSRTDEFKPSKPPKWFSHGKRKLNITLTQIRNNCSALAQDLVNNHIQVNQICQNCNLNRAEDANHYFMVCPKYNNIRHAMRRTVQTLDVPWNLETVLSGSTDHNYNCNKEIVDSVHQFITLSKRF